MPSVGAGPEAQMADNELQALVKDKLAEFRNTLIGKDKDLAIFDLRLVADDPIGRELPSLTRARIGSANAQHSQLLAARREEDDVDGMQGASTRRAR